MPPITITIKLTEILENKGVKIAFRALEYLPADQCKEIAVRFARGCADRAARYAQLAEESFTNVHYTACRTAAAAEAAAASTYAAQSLVFARDSGLFALHCAHWLDESVCPRDSAENAEVKAQHESLLKIITEMEKSQ